MSLPWLQHVRLVSATDGQTAAGIIKLYRLKFLPLLIEPTAETANTVAEASCNVSS